MVLRGVYKKRGVIEGETLHPEKVFETTTVGDGGAGQRYNPRPNVEQKD